MREKLINVLNDWAKKENDGIRTESLADYLIEHNVIPVPFKKGDVVYWVRGYEIDESTITEILFETEEIYGQDEDRLGTDMFLTREEAEVRVQKNKEKNRKKRLEWEKNQKENPPIPDKTMKERIAEHIEDIFEEAQENKDEKPIEETIADYLIDNGAVIIPKEAYIYFLDYEEPKIKYEHSDFMFMKELKEIEKTQDVYFTQDEAKESYKEYLQEGVENTNRNKNLRGRLIEYIRHGYGQGKDHEDERPIEETIAEYLTNNSVVTLEFEDRTYFVGPSEKSEKFRISYTGYSDASFVSEFREYEGRQTFYTEEEAKEGLKILENRQKKARETNKGKKKK